MAKTPLHAKLVDVLEDYIKSVLHPNDKLPSERELSKRYSVSRNTVRTALNELALRGFIYRSIGNGTFVAEQIPQRTDLSATYSFTDQMRDMGRTPKTIIQSFELETPSDYVAHKMNLGAQDRVYKLQRQRAADGVPMMVERTYLPESLMPNLTRADLEKESLYQLMAHKFDIEIASADESFYAGLMPDEEAKFLEVQPKSACLNIQRVTHAVTGAVVEFTLSIARADQFVYHVHHINH